jgi:hypothetical protein
MLETFLMYLLFHGVLLCNRYFLVIISSLVIPSALLWLLLSIDVQSTVGFKYSIMYLLQAVLGIFFQYILKFQKHKFLVWQYPNPTVVIGWILLTGINTTIINYQMDTIWP